MTLKLLGAVLLFALITLLSPVAGEAQRPGSGLNDLTPGTPDASACGASRVTGGNTAGYFFMGPGITGSCDVNFSATQAFVPVCTISAGITSGAVALAGVTSSKFTLAYSGKDPVIVFYHCTRPR